MFEIAYRRQLEKLEAHRAELMNGGTYPFAWADLLGNVIIPTFTAFQRRIRQSCVAGMVKRC